jgi:hypothetical protein
MTTNPQNHFPTNTNHLKLKTFKPHFQGSLVGMKKVMEVRGRGKEEEGRE